MGCSIYIYKKTKRRISVIREREKYSYCVEYLDNLHPNRKLQRKIEKEAKRKEKLEQEFEEANADFEEESIERYSY